MKNVASYENMGGCGDRSTTRDGKKKKLLHRGSEIGPEEDMSGGVPAMEPATGRMLQLQHTSRSRGLIMLSWMSHCWSRDKAFYFTLSFFFILLYPDSHLFTVSSAFGRTFYLSVSHMPVALKQQTSRYNNKPQIIFFFFGKRHENQSVSVSWDV